MPIVLEYTSRRYQARRAIRRAAASLLMSVVVICALIGAWASSASRQPTFRDIVAVGYEDSSGSSKVRIESYQTLADKTFRLLEKWDAARARQRAVMPYLRLVWSAVPVTNVVSDLASILDSRYIEPLRPAGFSVRVQDRPDDWSGLDGGFARTLRASVRWRTVSGHDEDTAAAACAAISNLFESASAIVATNVVVRKVDFPGGNNAGLDVVAEFDFPTVRRMPYSANLPKVAARLRAFHKEAAETTLFPPGDMSVKQSLQAAFGELDDKRPRPTRFEDSMDPGRWIVNAGLKAWGGLGSAGARRTVEVWNDRVGATLPWKRGLQARLLSSPNFLSPPKLQELLAALPSPNDLDSVSEAFAVKCAGFTNALENAAFSEFDLNVFDPAELHDTANLLDVAEGTSLVPTNRLLVAIRTGEKLILKHPRRKTTGGVFLPLPDSGGVLTNRFDFAQWRYSYASTNSTATVRNVGDGLSAFAGAGHGYAPESVEVSLDPDGRVVSFSASGLLPVRLPVEEK